jgi:hypothetical protein
MMPAAGSQIAAVRWSLPPSTAAVYAPTARKNA